MNRDCEGHSSQGCGTEPKECPWHSDQDTHRVLSGDLPGSAFSDKRGLQVGVFGRCDIH